MRLTEEQKKNLVEDYRKGESWDSLCCKYATNLNTIHKILNKYQVKRDRSEKLTWPVEKQDLLRQMYLSNCTYKEMYKALDCKGGTLTYWVHKLNLPLRGSGRNNNYPNRFLENTPESNYWLGYILADGHIDYRPDKRRGTVYLCSKEEGAILKFKEWYNGYPQIYKSSYKLKNGTTRYIYKALLHDVCLAKWFREDLQIDNVKHHTLNPNIPITWDIIRGFFDGDGSSAKGEWQLKSCSKSWLERIQTFIKQEGIETVLRLSYSDCWGLFAYKKADALKIASLMYANKYYCHDYKYKNFFEPCIRDNTMKTE